jgi:hypothetical protein
MSVRLFPRLIRINTNCICSLLRQQQLIPTLSTPAGLKFPNLRQLERSAAAPAHVPDPVLHALALAVQIFEGAAVRLRRVAPLLTLMLVRSLQPRFYLLTPL